MAEETYKVVLSGAASGEFAVTRERPLTIGRGADVKVEAKAVLRRHCRIEVGDLGLELHDLASLTGTRVNGTKISRVALSSGDKIQIGEATLVVRYEEEEGDGADVALGDERTTIASTTAKRLRQAGFSDIQFVDSSRNTLVFDAIRKNLDQPVTLKVLRSRSSTSMEAKRFVREARIAAKLSHTNIVRLYDARSEHKVLYMVLERFEGRTLLDEIEVSGKLTPQRALAVAYPLAKAIGYAHELGVIHRNVNPANVLITERGEVKLLDFGLAKSLRDAKAKQLTRVGEGLGTVGYASPEQLAEGSAATEISDIYGVGATLYHMLAGRPPHQSGEDQSQRKDPPPLRTVVSDVPEPVLKIVKRCMSKDPAGRYWGARQLLHEMESAIRDVFDFREGFVNLDLLARTARNDTPIMRQAYIPGDVDELSSSKEPQFLGKFSRHELVELAQMLEINRKAGILEVAPEDGPPGSIKFREGVAIQARYQSKKGEEAIVELLSIEQGSFRFVVEESDAEAEHELSIGPLLMEVMRRRDETARG
ncbi:protein kinase [Planctomycetota bacterium]